MFVDFNILNQLGSPSLNSNTFANRPAAGQTGRLFVSIDTFEIYRDNGTTWDLIGGPGTSTITGTGTATQVAYFTSSQAIGSSSNLYWDNANTRLGIGTSAPTVRLDIHGTGNMLHINSTSATANAVMSFQRTGTNVWRLGDQYNGGSNYFELHNTALNNNAIEVLAASNEATFLSRKTYSSGNAIGVAVQHNLTIPNAVNVGLAAIGGVNSNLNLTLGGSTTVAATGRQGLEGSTTINFTGAGTLTMTQGSTVRAFSALSSVYAFNGSAVGTITHLAGLRICFPDNVGSAVNITNNYALLINNQTTGTGTVTYTNRWGIYQEGASDLNYMAANLLLGSTVNTGEKLQVTGNANITAVCKANQFIVGTPTDLTRSFAASGDANSIALWLEEYGGAGTVPDIFMNRGRGSVASKSNVLVGDGLGGMAFAGFLNNNLLPSISFGATVVNLNTIDNIADADFSLQQTFNSTSFNTNFTVFANGGNADIRGSVTAASFIPDSSTIPTNGMYLSSANNLSFATNGTEKVRFTSGGTLRVGTPAFSLGSISTSDNIIVFDNKIQYINIGMISDNAFINTDWFSGAGGATPNLLFQVGGVTRSRINTTGNFLVNRSIDNGLKLQVTGDIYTSDDIYLDNGKYIRFQRSSGGLYIQTLGISSGTDDVLLNTTGDFYLRNGSNQNLIKTTNAGNSEFLGNIKTGAPNGGTAANWKLGTRVAATVALDTTQYIELDVNGTLYKLAIVT